MGPLELIQAFFTGTQEIAYFTGEQEQDVLYDIELLEKDLEEALAHKFVLEQKIPIPILWRASPGSDTTEAVEEASLQAGQKGPRCKARENQWPSGGVLRQYVGETPRAG